MKSLKLKLFVDNKLLWVNPILNQVIYQFLLWIKITGRIFRNSSAQALSPEILIQLFWGRTQVSLYFLKECNV